MLGVSIAHRTEMCLLGKKFYKEKAICFIHSEYQGYLTNYFAILESVESTEIILYFIILLRNYFQFLKIHQRIENAWTHTDEQEQ